MENSGITGKNEVSEKKFYSLLGLSQRGGHMASGEFVRITRTSSFLFFICPHPVHFLSGTFLTPVNPSTSFLHANQLPSTTARLTGYKIDIKSDGNDDGYYDEAYQDSYYQDGYAGDGEGSYQEDGYDGEEYSGEGFEEWDEEKEYREEDKTFSQKPHFSL